MNAALPRLLLTIPWLAAASMIVAIACVAAVSSVPLAIFLLLTFVYFAGGGALQFDSRHLFHLETLPWLFLAIPIATFMALARGRVRWWGRGFGLGLGAVLLLLSTWLCLEFAASRYQQRHVTSLFVSYLDAEREAVPTVDENLGDFVLVRVLD